MARGKTTAEGNPNKHHLVCSFYVLCWDTEMPWTKCSLGHHAGEGTHRPWNLQSSLSSAMQPHSRHARQEGEGAVLEVSSPAPAVTVPRCLDHLQLRPEMWVRDKHPCSALHYWYAKLMTEMIGFYATKIWRRFYAALDDSNTEDFFFFCILYIDRLCIQLIQNDFK